MQKIIKNYLAPYLLSLALIPHIQSGKDTTCFIIYFENGSETVQIETKDQYKDITEPESSPLLYSAPRINLMKEIFRNPPFNKINTRFRNNYLLLTEGEDAKNSNYLPIYLNNPNSLGVDVTHSLILIHKKDKDLYQTYLNIPGTNYTNFHQDKDIFLNYLDLVDPTFDFSEYKSMLKRNKHARSNNVNDSSSDENDISEHKNENEPVTISVFMNAAESPTTKTEPFTAEYSFEKGDPDWDKNKKCFIINRSELIKVACFDYMSPNDYCLVGYNKYLNDKEIKLTKNQNYTLLHKEDKPLFLNYLDKTGMYSYTSFYQHKDSFKEYQKIKNPRLEFSSWLRVHSNNENNSSDHENENESVTISVFMNTAINPTEESEPHVKELVFTKKDNNFWDKNERCFLIPGYTIKEMACFHYNHMDTDNYHLACNKTTLDDHDIHASGDMELILIHKNKLNDYLNNLSHLNNLNNDQGWSSYHKFKSQSHILNRTPSPTPSQNEVNLTGEAIFYFDGKKTTIDLSTIKGKYTKSFIKKHIGNSEFAQSGRSPIPLKLYNTFSRKHIHETEDIVPNGSYLIAPDLLLLEENVATEPKKHKNIYLKAYGPEFSKSEQLCTIKVPFGKKFINHQKLNIGHVLYKLAYAGNTDVKFHTLHMFNPGMFGKIFSDGAGREEQKNARFFYGKENITKDFTKNPIQAIKKHIYDNNFPSKQNLYVMHKDNVASFKEKKIYETEYQAKENKIKEYMTQIKELHENPSVHSNKLAQNGCIYLHYNDIKFERKIAHSSDLLSLLGGIFDEISKEEDNKFTYDDHFLMKDTENLTKKMDEVRNKLNQQNLSDTEFNAKFNKYLHSLLKKEKPHKLILIKKQDKEAYITALKAFKENKQNYYKQSLKSFKKFKNNNDKLYIKGPESSEWIEKEEVADIKSVQDLKEACSSKQNSEKPFSDIRNLDKYSFMKGKLDLEVLEHQLKKQHHKNPELAEEKFNKAIKGEDKIMLIHKADKDTYLKALGSSSLLKIGLGLAIIGGIVSITGMMAPKKQKNTPLQLKLSSPLISQ